MTEPTLHSTDEAVLPVTTEIIVVPVAPAAAPVAAQPTEAHSDITFASFKLPQQLSDTLAKMNYTTPTPIQQQAIPLALAGQDILGSAQTGTGKTAAFGIPLIVKLMSNPRGAALVMTPTRELATQVMTVLKQMLGTRSTIQTALLIGGESMGPQFQQLRNRPRLIVGTPGRINDHLERGTLMLHDAGFLVLDETDRMLDMGFSIQLEKICKFLPKTRQTLLFSATMPGNIMKLSQAYLTNPARISVGQSHIAAPKIKHVVIHTSDSDKYEKLIQELHAREGSIIIFVKTKRGADRLAEKLTKQKMSADAIHGDLKQSRRDRVIAAFREKKHRIMVATDVAARGLDIPHIEHVINYDLPHAPEDFIHRIGRTARAGAEGSALSFVSPDDNGRWRDIHRLMHPGEAPLPRHTGGQPNGPQGNNGGGQSKRRPWHKRRGPGQGTQPQRTPVQA
jgi:superfamily II DNA/RNA helicase